MSFPFKHSEGPQEQAEKPTMFESKQQFFIFSLQDVARVFAAFYAGFLLLKCSLLEYSIVAESPALLRSGDRAGGWGGLDERGYIFSQPSRVGGLGLPGTGSISAFSLQDYPLISAAKPG